MGKISLNHQQKRAVEYEGGPLLLVAGAGTGKTRVITERIKWLIENGKAAPSEILALTFTEKAAEEMLERVDVAMPLGYEEPWLSTFHAFADRILRAEGLEIGLDPAYKILTPPEAWLLVRENLFDFDLKYYRPLGNPTKFISAMLTLFSRAQDEDTAPADFVRWAKLKSQRSKLKTDEKKEDAEKYLELANAYKTYHDLKIKESYLDFGDLITWTLKLFRERPAVLKKYQQQLKYILVDEFQDTNYAQYQLIKLLAPSEDRPNLLVVGDDFQAIYKFRGASVSNILNFKKDYPKAETIIMNKCYRSPQKILDSTYRLIKNNEPDTLEVKLKIDKSLVSQKDTGAAPKIIHAANGLEEAESVVREIIAITNQQSTIGYRDFAILARANSHLEPFVAALKRAGIPYQRIGNRGLFGQEEIRDVLALLRVLVDPEDTVSLYRTLNLECLGLDPLRVHNWFSKARKSRQPLWEVVDDEKTTSLLTKYRRLIPKKSVTQIIFELLTELKFVEQFTREESIENRLKIKNLNLFIEKSKQFMLENEGATLPEFVDYLDLLIEAGEDPAQAEIEDIDTVNLLTVHAAKGLEFKVVFLVNLVADRFPTRNRRDPLPLPDELIKETLPEGAAHIQEERRLFYVGCTRAKDRLFLTWGEDYGGVRKKKPSGFLRELGVEIETEDRDEERRKQLTAGSLMTKTTAPRLSNLNSQISAPKYISYSQLEAFKTCPLQYYYRYILGIPEPPNHALSFGQTIHRTLRDFHREDFEKEREGLERLFYLYERHWIPEGYDSKEHKEKRFEEGKEVLKKYHKEGRQQLGKPLHLEKKFTLKFGQTPLIGSIDRIDTRADGRIEIVDYKTGKVKTQKEVDKDDQLTIYALAAKEALGIEPQSLCLFFVDENRKFETTRSNDQLEEKREEIIKMIKEIKKTDFKANVGFHCNWCPFNSICTAYKKSDVT